MRGQLPSIPQTDSFIQNFYDDSARKLFQPLKDLEGRESSKLPLSNVSNFANNCSG
jgi:protein phosphatase-4 regulatory subunit 3